FAGTLSPNLMDSRTDGALVEVTVPSSDTIQGAYVRYTQQDPLCCPSAKSTATFKVDRSGTLPVVVLQSVSIESTDAASTPAPTAAPVAGQANCFPETGFCIINPKFADYFVERGG